MNGPQAWDVGEAGAAFLEKQRLLSGTQKNQPRGALCNEKIDLFWEKVIDIRLDGRIALTNIFFDGPLCGGLDNVC